MSHLCILAGGQVVLPVTDGFEAELITRDHLGSVLDAITPLEVARDVSRSSVGECLQRSI